MNIEWKKSWVKRRQNKTKSNQESKEEHGEEAGKERSERKRERESKCFASFHIHSFQYFSVFSWPSSDFFPSFLFHCAASFFLILLLLFSFRRFQFSLVWFCFRYVLDEFLIRLLSFSRVIILVVIWFVTHTYLHHDSSIAISVILLMMTILWNLHSNRTLCRPNSFRHMNYCERSLLSKKIKETSEHCEQLTFFEFTKIRWSLSFR